ncbi:MAG: ATP-dependent zinc metalloprotease FtsH [Acidimicrobiales bacterium]
MKRLWRAAPDGSGDHQEGPARPSGRRWKVLGALGVLVVIAVILAVVVTRGPKPTNLTLNTYLHDVSTHQVASVTVVDGAGTATGKLADGTHYVVSYDERFASTLTADLLKANVPVHTQSGGTSIWVTLLGDLPLFLVGAFIIVVLTKAGGGARRLFSFGQIGPRAGQGEKPKVSFADVAGADEAVEELREVKEFLEAPATFEAMGAKIPRGILLHGPPGTGKTLLARAVAGESGARFFSISGSDFVEMFVGVGAARVRDLFTKARASSPAIVFVDEIDAVGRHRGSGMGGGHDEREQTLNQLLVEMDGFDPAAGVVLIAATNRPDILDPALLRPGRFDRQIVVDRPDLAGRRAILDVHSRDKRLAPGVDLGILARRTPGFTGADLANLVNESALLATRHRLDSIGMVELEEAIDRTLAGPERRTRLMSDSEKQVIAYHEGGHTLVGHVLVHADPVHKVSIVARGQALGWTLALPLNDRYLVTRSELGDQLCVLMGGRAAEELAFSESTTGAQNDIAKATEIARAMVTEFGMSDKLGPRSLAKAHGETFLGREMATRSELSDEMAAQVDAEVGRLLSEAYERAGEILSTHRDTLQRLASALVVHETLGPEGLAEILGDLAPWPVVDYPKPSRPSTLTPEVPRIAAVEGR